jgi:carboxyl-terminal processing protease
MKFSRFALILLFFSISAQYLHVSSAQRNRTSRSGPASSQTHRRSTHTLALSTAQVRREEAFRIVWNTVKYDTFDRTYGGVDWDAIRELYAPQVKKVTSDAELHSLLQKMVGELHQSHFTIIPPDSIPKFVRRRTRPAKAVGEETSEDLAEDEPDDPEAEGNGDLSTKLLNGVGIDVRVLDGQVVITHVDPGGNAARAGLRTGYIIKKLDNASVEVGVKYVTEKAATTPYLNFAIRQSVLTSFLGGRPGTDVELVFLDQENKEQRTVIKRERLSGELSPPIGNFPPMYTEFEARRLASGIGYLRFSTFTPQLMEKICSTLKSMEDAPGIVIDLRANPGGIIGMASGVSGLLVSKPGLVGALQTRSGQSAVPSYPQRHSYKGPVAILIDRLSGSTAEIFAAAMQEWGRAIIVGENSAGVVQGADTVKLPTGAVFEFARMGFKTAHGMTLEGKGVKPDVEKQLTRNSLLQGKDDQLEEAVQRIQVQQTRDVYTAEPPPPPKPIKIKIDPAVGERLTPAKGSSSEAGPHTLEISPEAEQIMERYITEVGGRDALNAVKTRVSTGTADYGAPGMSGKVIIREEPPEKRSMEMTIPSLGVMQIAFDSKHSWMAHPLIGMLEFEKSLLAPLQSFFDFHKIPEYKTRYAKIEYNGIVDSSDGKVNVLVSTLRDGTKEVLLFDIKTGLLSDNNEAHYSDYRQVGRVKIPFATRITVNGANVLTKLDKVEDNVAIDADAFKEIRSCFTQR